MLKTDSILIKIDLSFITTLCPAAEHRAKKIVVIWGRLRGSFLFSRQSRSFFADEWGEWGACSVTCGTGQRSRDRCNKNLKPEKKCPPGQVRTETEECSAVSCSSSSFQGDYVCISICKGVSNSYCTQSIL